MSRLLLHRAFLLVGAIVVAVPTPRAPLPPLFPPEPCAAPAPSPSSTFDAVLSWKGSDGLVRFRHAAVTIVTEDAETYFTPGVLDVEHLHLTLTRRVLVSSPGGLPETVEESGDVDVAFHPEPEPTPTPGGRR